MGLLGGIGMLFSGVLFFIVIILGVIGLVHYLQNTNHASGNNFNNNVSNSTSNNAINILNERYARGEINEDEYTKMKSEILKS